MTPSVYNNDRIQAGELTAQDLEYLWLRFPGRSFEEAVALFQSIRGLNGELRVDGMLGPKTQAALPTRELRAGDPESLIALSLAATAGRRYVFGAEPIKSLPCRLLTWGEAAAALRPVRAWDCSELVEACCRMLGVLIDGRPLVDGAWRQYAQLAKAGRAAYSMAGFVPGDLVFTFRDQKGRPVTPDGSQRPAQSHVAILLNDRGDVIEAAPVAVGPTRARMGGDVRWTHEASLFD